MKEETKRLTKQILEKYNIHEEGYETYRLRGNHNDFFVMRPRKDGRWNYDHRANDNSVKAASIIETEDELVTALKFSKLYEQPENTPPLKDTIVSD